jgi:hypothetical protein
MHTFAGLGADCSKPLTSWLCDNLGHTNTMLDGLWGYLGNHPSCDAFSSPFSTALSPYLGVSPLACLLVNDEPSFCESPLGAHFWNCLPAAKTARTDDDD